MKKTIINFASLLIMLSCNNADRSNSSATTTETSSNESAGLTVNEDEDKTGEFSFDGKTVTGKVSTQYFGDKEKGNFSVLCQHDESATSANFELLQVTFVNEKDATTNTSLKLYSGSQLPMTEPEAGSYTVALSGNGAGFNGQEFVGSDQSTGSLSVSNRTVTIKDLVLYTRDGDKKTVNAKIPF